MQFSEESGSSIISIISSTSSAVKFSCSIYLLLDKFDNASFGWQCP